MKWLIAIIILSSCEKVSIRQFHSHNRKPYVDWTDGIIIFDGNSLTNSQLDGGYGTGLKYPERVIQNAPWSTTELFGQAGDLSATCANGCVVYNFGVNGQQTQAMIDDGVSQIDSLYNASKKCAVVAWEMSNDLYFNGSTSGAQTRFQTYCEARKAAGFYVIVITATTRDWGGGTSPGGDSVAAFNAKIPTLNTWLRANYTAFADKLIDLDLDSRLTDHTDATYFFDSVHHNGTARNILGDLVAAELLTVPQ